MEKLGFNKAHTLAFKRYGMKLGMFGRLLTKNGTRVQGKYISYGMNKIITREELLNIEKNEMEIDKKVIELEKQIATLMTLRRQHRDEIRNISDEINVLETNVRLRKVQINNERIDKKV